MGIKITVQGKRITDQEIQLIEELIEKNPDWHRTRLSRELCKIWQWQTETGQAKDMSCRLLLRKLSALNLIKLPVPQGRDYNHIRNKTPKPVEHEQAPIQSSLAAISPIKICPVATKQQEALFSFLVHQYHYLSYQGTTGKNIKYLVWDNQGRPLACLLFDSAAWKTKDRDNYIGWDKQHQQKNLQYITNNSRFLILPWIKVPHLASHILGCIVRRINSDWLAKYQHRLLMLETFVEQQRFRGTCYKAANWLKVGATTGRTRNDRYKTIKVPIKDIYLYPLSQRFREELNR